ncbi:hypothetical protein V2S66_03460 [Streptomyces sp. V4-01]|uniref:Uncharacterized protein n=1 Tax=Actinacidiphila polyblastidii TaxID=3110430 RepID=A0ABU7P5D5_9ACTN|nr:hypothetical protein [Streptomyces sp. V4-01]
MSAAPGGAGPASVDGPEKPPEHEFAWAAYQHHRGLCHQCRESLWRCPDGNELWNSFITAAKLVKQ